MFGKVRPPPSPPESLERDPAKIIKDDPLSVFESTLLKLKQGSTLDTVLSSSETEVKITSSSSVYSKTSGETRDLTLWDDSDAMAIDSASSECESTKQQEKKKPSVRSIYWWFKKQAEARNVSHTDPDAPQS